MHILAQKQRHDILREHIGLVFKSKNMLIAKINNFVIFAENVIVAQQEARGIRNYARRKFKEGDNYSYTYWGASESTLQTVKIVIYV